ncbi:MAG: Ig-like domain-containing protein, partial [Anaerolineae bacterium]
LLITAGLFGCAADEEGEQVRALDTPTPPPTATAGPTSTPLPPPPQVQYIPVADTVVSPIIVERSPARGAALRPDGAVEIVFDRPMDAKAVEAAFTLQSAGGKAVAGELSWPDGRTVRFQPAQSLIRNTAYDAVLTQDATDLDGTPLAAPYVFRFFTTGFLEVAQVIPADGTAGVETDSSITVMFNRPVVPLNAISDFGFRISDSESAIRNRLQPLVFDPPVEGEGRWLNTSIYIFRPGEPLAGGTTYTAQVAAGLTDATGEALLPKDFTWRFATALPKVVWVQPADDAKLVDVDIPVKVQFNQPVGADSVRTAFRLQTTVSVLRGQLTPQTVSGKIEVDGNTVTFTPDERLAFDQTYQVTIAPGVTSAAGGAGMSEAYTWRFTTVPLPRIVDTEPRDGEKNARPYTGFQIRFNTPIDPTTVMPNISMTPPITPTQVYTYYNRWDNTFFINFGAQPSTDYEVRIEPGIADPYGNKIEQGLTVRFRTAPLDPDFRLHVPDIIGTYNAYDPARLYVAYVNVNRINLRLYRLSNEDLFQPPYRVIEELPAQSTPIRQWELPLETPLNKRSYAAIDLVEGGGKLEPGVYLLDSDAPEVSDRGFWGRRHLLIVSHINLTVKAGPKDAIAWATDLATGDPVSGLTLSFFSEGDAHLGTAMTDAAGVARLDLPSGYRGSLLVYSEKPFTAGSQAWVRGTSPWDFGLQGAGWTDFTVHTYTDRPIYRPGQTVYIKGVIRAEDDVSYSLPDFGQVRVTVRDANYEEIFNQLLDLGAAGTFNGELTLSEGASLGYYQIGVQFLDRQFGANFQVAAYRPPEFEVTVDPGADEVLKGQDIQAAVNVNYFFGGPVADAPVEWNVLAETYIFKPPWGGRYRFTDVDDPWVCFDCWWYRREESREPILSGTGTTDAQGQVVINLSGEELREQLPEGSVRVIIEASVTGRDNQVISGRGSLIAHRGEWYVGLSPQQYVGDAGDDFAVDLIAVDWDGKRLPEREIAVNFYRREWKNTFVKNEAGGGRWETKTEDTLVETLRVTTDELGEAVAGFVPPQGGVYKIVAEDPDPASDVRSSIFVWVSGREHVSWRRENHDRINLISDKTSYEPGETAEILIPSPFAGPHWALVTVERGRVIRHEVVRITSNSQVYKLPLHETDAPNIYVSVVLIKGQTEDAPLADYKVGLLPLDVTPRLQTLNVSVTPDRAQAQPGDEVTYIVETTDVDGNPVSAELSLDLVDKAVLSLLPRASNAIKEAFYGRRGLGIQTASGLAISVNRLLQEIEEDLGITPEAPVRAMGAPMPAAPVDERMVEKEVAAEAPAAPPPGVELREEFADTAYWNPLVITDPYDGIAQVTVTLPDNLTTWVMRGVGLTGGPPPGLPLRGGGEGVVPFKVGEGTSDVVATLPLLIRPVAPRFFVVDDRAELAALVSNNTDEPFETKVSLSADGVTLQSPSEQTVTIPARSEVKVTWDVVAQDVTQSQLIFAAVSEKYSDAAKPRLTTGPEGSLLVLRYSAPDIVGTAGQLTEAGSRTEVVALPPRYDARKGELSVRLDPSLAAGMRDGLTYLQHFPYECTEQTVSRFLPNVLTYQALTELGIKDEELAEKLPGLVKEGLEKLYLQQHSDGGWGWWVDDESNPHLSAYVVFALLKAREAGFGVRSDVISNGESYLLKWVRATREFKNYRDANQQAFLLYVLAEDGQAPGEALDALYKDREKLSHFGRAFLALSLSLSDETDKRVDTLLSDINNAAILSATGAHWEEENYDWWAMNTDTRSTAVILDALARLDPDNGLIPNVVRWLMIARKDGIWETTQETAWALIGLTDWMRVTGELDADYAYTATLDDQVIASGKAFVENGEGKMENGREKGEGGFRLPSSILHLPISILKSPSFLTFARGEGSGRLYYTAHLKVYLPVEEIEPADRGIIVQRRYTLASCQDGAACPDVREAALGDVIRVDLTIIAPNDLYYVVVEDPLPAGAEAIDTGLATTSLLAMGPGLRRQSPTFFGPEGEAAYYPFYWWWNWYSRSELRDEKVVLFADYLPKGTYEYAYTMRATLPGDYHVIPTVAREFYFPEVFGRSDGRLLSIGR